MCDPIEFVNETLSGSAHVPRITRAVGDMADCLVRYLLQVFNVFIHVFTSFQENELGAFPLSQKKEVPGKYLPRTSFFHLLNFSYLLNFFQFIRSGFKHFQFTST
jgi:hypothetical protein